MGNRRDVSILTPGERIKNWMEAAAAAWPIILFLLGGAVYGNSETVKRWIHGEPLPEIEGEVSGFTEEDIHPAVRQRIEALIAKVAELEKRDNSINAHGNKHDKEQDARLDNIERLVQ